MRKAEVSRATGETRIEMALEVDGSGESDVQCGIGFLSHMLQTFAKHGLFDLRARIEGDLNVDQHHTAEDAGIVLGECFRRALGEKRGIERAGCFSFPMDEALCSAAIDLSGRPYLAFDCEFARETVGAFQTDVVEDFFRGFSQSALCALHLSAKGARSDHHAVEGLFKAFGRALRAACAENPRIAGKVPSTKGVI